MLPRQSQQKAHTYIYFIAIYKTIQAVSINLGIGKLNNFIEAVKMKNNDDLLMQAPTWELGYVVS